MAIFYHIQQAKEKKRNAEVVIVGNEGKTFTK